MSRKRIAVLMASIDREYQRDFVTGVFAAAAEADLDVCVFNCQGYMNVSVSTSDQGEGAIFDLPLMSDFDGVISLRATFADDVTLRKAQQILHHFAGKPHISIDVPDNRAITIQFDDAVSVRQLTNHVIREHGARRIVYLSGPLNQLVAMTRLLACQEAMRENGLEMRREDIFEGEWIHQSGRDCAKQLLEREEGLPDAILCGNDDMAFGVVEYLQEHGCNVPDQVLVTGFDALREAGARGLTSIRRPIGDAARRAVEILEACLRGETPAETDLLLPTIPEYDISCGCPSPRPVTRTVMRSVRTSRRSTEGMLLLISMFYGSLSGAVDEEDAHGKLDQFVRAMGIRELYLCVQPALSRDVSPGKQEHAYPEEMLLLYGCRGDRVLPITLFPTRELVPAVDGEPAAPLALVFCPLYYRDRNFGYVAMEMSPAAGQPLYSLLMLLNGTLTSLYLQHSLRNYARKMEAMSEHDIMTGMLNRRGFMERSPRLLEQARKEGSVFLLLSADMNHMKQINDQFGHLAGDQAICRMGRAMERLQEYGIHPVHISGDEFLAYGIVSSPEAAEEMLQNARRFLFELNREEPWIAEISASFGEYAAIPGEKDSIDLYLTRADRAMYEDKRRRQDQEAAGSEPVTRKRDGEE